MKIKVEDGQEVYAISVEKLTELLRYLNPGDMIAISPHMDSLLPIFALNRMDKEYEHVGIINLTEDGKATFYDEGF